MSQQLDIFNFFMSEEDRAAIAAEEAKKKEEEKKAEAEKKKKSAAKKKNSSKTTTTTGAQSLQEVKIGEEGITILTGYYPEKTLLPKDFEKEISEGETITCTSSEVIRVAINNGLESFVEGHAKIAKLKSGKYLMTTTMDSVSGGCLTDKSKMSGEYRIVLGSFETTISEKDSEDGEDGHFGLKEVQKIWYDAYPDFEKICDFVADKERKVIVPVFKKNPAKETKNGLIYIFGNMPVTFENEKITDVVKREFSDFEGNYHIVQYGENEYFLVPHIDSGVAPKKEPMYPTTDVSISLVFSRIPLSPDMFGGKEQVTEKELLEKITEDYPEYGNGRASIEYLKKDKLILVSIKSAKKGSGFSKVFETETQDAAETLEKAKCYLQKTGKEHALCFLKFPQNQVRLEKNAIGTFIGGGDFKQFQMKLPKIPRSIMEEVYTFFLAVKNTMPRSNEAATQIFWDKKEKKYFIYYPKQVVDTVSVNFERSVSLEHDMNNILVMDVHSHGVIRPTFSGTDDRDEKGTRLFCVLGDMDDTSAYHFSLRAGTGGNFIPVADEDVFEDFYDGMFTSKKVLELSRKDEIRFRELIADKVMFK